MHRCRRLQNVGADTACGCRIHALGHLGRPGGLPAQNACVQCPKPVQCLAGTLCRTTPCRRLPKSGWTLKTRSGCSQPPKSYELARSLMIVQVCAIPTIVKNASQLYKTATKALGQTLPDSVIRASFFKHFCGGENESDLMPAMKRLGDNGQVWELSSTAPQRRTSTQLHAATTVRIPIASGR